MRPIDLYSFRAPEGQDAGGRIIPPGLQEIEIITGGRGYFELDGTVLEATCGTMLWHLPGEQTIWRNDYEHPYECLVAKFPWDGTGPRPAPRVSRWPDPLACTDFVNELSRHFHGPNPDLELMAAYAWATLRWQAMRRDSSKDYAAHSAPMRKALAFIDHFFAKPLTIAELASEALISEAQLFSLFAKEIGMSPHQFILKRRFDEAGRLLRHSGFSVKEIACSLGYPDMAVFCRNFKRHHGCTPGQYRSTLPDPLQSS